jgi:hypothetical protein
MLRSLRTLWRPRDVRLTYCEVDGSVCTPACEAESLREHAREQAFRYLGPGLR